VPPPPPDACGHFSVQHDLQAAPSNPSLFVSPASDRLVNTYLFPVTDASTHTDPNSPPSPVQCCAVCRGLPSTDKSLYTDLSTAAPASHCSAIFLIFAPTVGWICTFGAERETVASTSVAGSVIAYLG